MHIHHAAIVKTLLYAALIQYQKRCRSFNIKHSAKQLKTKFILNVFTQSYENDSQYTTVSKFDNIVIT